MPNVTGVAFNHNGTKIAANYSGNATYLFDTEKHKHNCVHAIEDIWEDGFSSYVQHYLGHRNFDTVKSVNFFGSNSEYIVTGSDCGRVFLYELYSGAIVTAFPADENIVNCITVCIFILIIYSCVLYNTLGTSYGS